MAYGGYFTPAYSLVIDIYSFINRVTEELN